MGAARARMKTVDEGIVGETECLWMLRLGQLLVNHQCGRRWEYGPESVLRLAVVGEDKGLRLCVAIRTRHLSRLGAEAVNGRRRTCRPGQRRPQTDGGGDDSGGHGRLCLMPQTEASSVVVEVPEGAQAAGYVWVVRISLSRKPEVPMIFPYYQPRGKCYYGMDVGSILASLQT